MSTRTRSVLSRSGLPRRRALASLSAVTAVALAAGTAGLSTASASTSWSTATSAAAGGGMSALVAAAKKEGTLNVIALPSNWANYGKEISTFHAKYGIKVNSEAPSDSSAQEIEAIKSSQGPQLGPGRR